MLNEKDQSELQRLQSIVWKAEDALDEADKLAEARRDALDAAYEALDKFTKEHTE